MKYKVKSNRPPTGTAFDSTNQDIRTESFLESLFNLCPETANYKTGIIFRTDWDTNASALQQRTVALFLTLSVGMRGLRSLINGSKQ